MPQSLASTKLVKTLFLTPLATQKKRLLAIIGALLMQNAADGVLILSVQGFAKALFSDPGQSPIPLAALLPNAVGHHLALTGVIERSQLALAVPLVILGAGIFKALGGYLYQLNQQALALFLAKGYREKLFRALLGLPYVEIRARQVGEWMSLVMNDVMLLQVRFSDVLTGLVKDTVAVAWYFLVLAWVHWPTALVLLALSPFVAFGMGRTGKRIARYSEAFQRELARLAGFILDARARFEFIRAEHGEKREHQRFQAMSRAYFEMIRKSILIRAAFAPLVEFLGFALFAVFVYAAGKGSLGHFSPGMLLQFLVALGLMLRPLREIGEQLGRYHETKGTLVASLAVFQSLENSESHDLPSAGDSNGGFAGSGGLPKSGLQIQRLVAGFAGEVKISAKNLSLVPGTCVAIVGPSGGGKSTLVKTLAGLIEPMVWTATLPWRETAGLATMVSQTPFLFDDTLMANLTYGQAQVHADEIWSALKAVNMNDEVAQRPGKLESHLRAIGSNVSGGQLQRLVLARALLRKRPLWLLDEATSAIDARSEKDILFRILDTCKAEEKSLLAITHRLTWLEAFDEVWFVERGQITLRGAHLSLLGNQRYRDFCVAETQGEVIAIEP